MKKRILIPLLAGLALLWACKGKGTAEYEVVNNSRTADTTKIDSAATSQPKLVKTAGIHFKVKNVQQTAERISALATSLNGMIVHHQMTSTNQRSQDIRISDDSVMRVTSFSTVADITVKIPQAKLEDFMNQVSRMGIYITNRSMDITDKSLDYLSSQLKLKNRTELVNQQKKGKVIIKKPEDVLLLKDDMIDEQINNMGINDAVKTSVITLSFYQSNTINKEIIANDDPSAYNLPFFKRLGMAIENGWELFVDVIVGLANLWVFILAGVGLWIVIRNYRSKKPVLLPKA
ncbi:MAG TPA: DUF4349 domain-containing protein [Mucilaginibacter sp.]|jgi:hypothetical protein